MARAAIGRAGYSPYITGSAQAAPVSTRQSCIRYLLPVNGSFLRLIFSPLSLLRFHYYSCLLFCLLFCPCLFFSFLPYCYFRLSCSFLCINKASLEPADNPLVLVTKKYPRAESPLGGINSCIAYIFIHLLPDDLTLRIEQCKNTIRQTKYFLGDAINLFCGYRIHSHR